MLLAVEYEGSSYGRHQRWGGYRGDIEKYNEAAILGWKVLRYGPRQWSMAKRQLQELIIRELIAIGKANGTDKH